MGMDMVDTGLILTMGVLKIFFRKDKKIGEWFIVANIQIAYGYFLWKHHCQAKAPSELGFLKRNYYIAYYIRLIGEVG